MDSQRKAQNYSGTGIRRHWFVDVRQISGRHTSRIVADFDIRVALINTLARASPSFGGHWLPRQRTYQVTHRRLPACRDVSMQDL